MYIIFLPSFAEIEIPPLSADTSSRKIGVNGRTDGRTTVKHNACRRLLLAAEASK